MALSLDSNQEALIGSEYMEHYWLFDVDDGSYHWSTKDVSSAVYNSTEYEFKVLPDSFSGVRLSRPRQEMGVQAPNELSFSIENKDNTLTASYFEGKDITVHLVITDGTTTEKIASWTFLVKQCNAVYQRMEFFCEDILQQYLEGDYPNSNLISSLSPADVQEQSDNMCVPVIFGEAFIPTRPIWVTDARYYLLGLAGPGTPSFDVIEVASPRDFPRSRWHSSSYTFTDSNKTIGGIQYKVFQPIIADSDSDDVIDACGIWTNGSTVQDCRTRFTREDTQEVTSPEEVIEFVAEDMGVPSTLLDTGSGSSFSAARDIYTDGSGAWDLVFKGGLFYKQPRPRVLSSLLLQCHSTIRVTDKIELHPLSNVSQETVTAGMVQQNSFRYKKIQRTSNVDCGYVGFSPSGEPQDEYVKVLVPAKSSIDDISTEIVEVPLVHDSQDAQRIGMLYYQRRYLKYANVSFTALPSMLHIQPDDVITISDADYGGTYDVLVDSMTINHNCSIHFNCIRFSQALDDWDDLSPGAVTPDTDTSTYTWSPAMTGPDSTTDEGYAPNVLPGRVRIGASGNFILLDPEEPIISLYEGANARVLIGDLATDDYGIEIYDASNELIMRVGGGGVTDSLAGWEISPSAIYMDNATLHSDGYLSLGDPPPTSYGNNQGAFLGIEDALDDSSGVDYIAKFSLYNDSNNYIKWDGEKVMISAANFTLNDQGEITASNATLSGSITATSGAIGGWIIGTTELKSASSGARIVLDKGKNRISVFKSDDSESVIMGYLEDVIRNEGSGTATADQEDSSSGQYYDDRLSDASKNWQTDTLAGLEIYLTGGTGSGQNKTIVSNTETNVFISGTWSTVPDNTTTYEIRYSATDYGFWAAQGDRLYIDGDVTYEAGDWVVERDAGYIIKNAAGVTVARFGSDTVQTTGIYATDGELILDTTGQPIIDTGGSGGETYHGLFIYDESGDQISRFHDGGFRIGGPTNSENYIEYDAETGILLMASNSPNALTIGNGGDIVIKDGGDITLEGGGDIYLANSGSNPAKLTFTGQGYQTSISGSSSSDGMLWEPNNTDSFITEDKPWLQVGRESNPWGFMSFRSKGGQITIRSDWDNEYSPGISRYAKLEANALGPSCTAFIQALDDNLIDSSGASYSVAGVYATADADDETYVSVTADDYLRLNFGPNDFNLKITDGAEDSDATELAWIEMEVDYGSTGYIRIYSSK